MKVLDLASQPIPARDLPGRKAEAWKYLSLKDLGGKEFRAVEAKKLSDEDKKQIRARMHRDCHHVVVWNGEFRPDYLNSRDVEPVAISSLDSAWSQFETQWLADEKTFGLTTEFYDDLVQGLRKTGIALRISSKTQVLKPIQLIVGGTSGSEQVSSCEIWLDAEPEAQFELLLDRRAEGSSGNLHLGRLRLRLQEMSKVEIVHLQDYGTSDYDFFRTTCFVGQAASLNYLTVQRGGKLTRHNADVIFTGELASVDLNGLYLASGEQVCDHHTLIDHAQGHNTSRQLYKGILNGTARAIFDGCVRMRKGAQKASSEQLNKNLLLSSTAEADSKPLLLIDADDVKATHGSAIGQMSEAELFYLESRGIRPDEARTMLARGFVDELIVGIPTLAFREIVAGIV